MGKERDRLIRSLGGTPLDESKYTDSEIIRIAWRTYFERGELPPELRKIAEEFGLVDELLERVKKQYQKPSK